MHSTAQTAPATSEIFNETASTGDACIRQRKQPMRLQKSSTKLILLVTHAFDSANSPCASEIFNETASTGDAWIRPRKQPVRPQKPSTKLLPLVTHGFDSANCPLGLRNHQRNGVVGDSKIINETASTGDACIRQRKQPLRPQKSSTKLLQLVTHEFDSANSPCGFRNLQRNCFHW